MNILCIQYVSVISGGAGGIRTLDRALQPYNGLANRRLQPLGHSSVRADMPDEGASRKRQIHLVTSWGQARPSRQSRTRGARFGGSQIRIHDRGRFEARGLDATPATPSSGKLVRVRLAHQTAAPHGSRDRFDLAPGVVRFVAR